MRSSLVGLQLLLACALVLGSPVMEERKEFPEQKELNLEELEKNQGEMDFPEQKELNLEELEELKELETLEGRARSYWEMMQRDNEIQFEMQHWKQKAMDYFNKHSPGAFYRLIEDTKVKVKSTTGTMLTFTVFLVDTNCTTEEGLRSLYEFDSSSSMEREHLMASSERVPCVALPKHQQRKLKCTFDMLMSGRIGVPSVVSHFCEPLVILEESEETPDLNDLLNSQELQLQHSEYQA